MDLPTGHYVGSPMQVRGGSQGNALDERLAGRESQHACRTRWDGWETEMPGIPGMPEMPGMPLRLREIRVYGEH